MSGEELQVLNSKQKARYKKLLKEKQEELLAGFNAARERGTQGADEADKDYIDYAVSSYTKEFLLSLSDLERRQLMRVQEALGEIDGDLYGICRECEEPISPKRLEAVPWTMYCLECQDLADRGLLASDHEDDQDDD
ncbi:MAG: TraR/DksA family transcriptional regulator [Acidobacteriota bacterium]